MLRRRVSFRIVENTFIRSIQWAVVPPIIQERTASIHATKNKGSVRRRKKKMNWIDEVKMPGSKFVLPKPCTVLLERKVHVAEDTKRCSQ